MPEATAGTVQVKDVHAALDAIAPFAGAEPWDNVGLLAGRMDWPAGKVLLAIDLTDAVAREALERGVDAVVAYHPPIFKELRRVTPDAGTPTTLLPDLLAERISVLSVHTALDAAGGGTNDVLLDAFEPVARYPLSPQIVSEQEYKLVVFVPPAEVAALRTALSEAGAGVIGNYSECSYELAGRGSFLGDESTNPTVGRKQVLEFVDEVRLELVCPRARVGEVIRTLYERHSYEEPAFDLYPLHTLAGRGRTGGGRVGVLAEPRAGHELVDRLAARVDCARAAVVGDLGRTFRSVTAAAGAFGVRQFRDRESLVITGEFKHHDALALLRGGVTAVVPGHYASERPVLDVLRQRLSEGVRGAGFEIAARDADPLRPLGERRGGT